MKNLQLAVVLLVLIMHSSGQTYMGGTMSHRFIDTTTVEVEGRVFVLSSSCGSSPNTRSTSITFDITPKGGSALTSLSAITTSNEEAHDCVDAGFSKGANAATKLYIFRVTIVQDANDYLHIRLDDAYPLVISIFKNNQRKYLGEVLNSSPRAAILRDIGLPDDTKTHSIDLVVFDNNFDDVRCRFPESSEHTGFIYDISGLSIKTAAPGSNELSSDCRLSITKEIGGTFSLGVNILVEDFPSKESTVPMSTIQIQFTLHYNDPGTSSSEFSKDVLTEVTPTSTGTSRMFNQLNFTYDIAGVSSLSYINRYSPHEAFSTASSWSSTFNPSDNSAEFPLSWIQKGFVATVEPICFGIFSSEHITVKMACSFVRIQTAKIQATPVYPRHFTIQQTEIPSFIILIKGVIKESDFPTDGGVFRIHKNTDDTSVAEYNVTCPAQCDLLSDNRIRFNVSFEASANEEDYYVTYTLNATYRNFNVPIEMLVNKADWVFKSKTYGSTTLLNDVYINKIMKLYTANDFLTEVTYPYTSQLGQTIYAGIKITGNSLPGVIHRCYATPTSSADDVDSFDIINDGCPVESLTTITKQTLPDFQFSFSTFRFTSSASSQVYLHCQIYVCFDDPSSCTPDCSSSRKRRSIADKKLTHLKIGPIFVEGEEHKSNIEIIRLKDLVQGEINEEESENTAEEDNNSVLSDNEKWFLIIYTCITSMMSLSYLAYRHYDYVTNY